MADKKKTNLDINEEMVNKKFTENQPSVKPGLNSRPDLQVVGTKAPKKKKTRTWSGRVSVEGNVGP